MPKNRKKGVIVPSSFAIMAATSDRAVADRLVAVAASMGVSESQVRGALRELVCVPVEVEGDATLASVYEYAATRRAQLQTELDAALAEVRADFPIPPEPGTDPAALTDSLLRAALVAYFQPPKP